MNNHLITRLENSELKEVCSDDLIESYVESGDVIKGFSPDNLILIFGSRSNEKDQIKTVLGVCSDLLSQVERSINNLKEIGTSEEQFAKEDELIDRELKSHIRKIIKDVTRLNNSSTMRGDMKQFHDHDKIDLGVY